MASKISSARQILASPERVFDVLVMPEYQAHWDRELRSLEFLEIDGAPYKVGARFYQLRRFWKKVQAKVTDFEYGRRYAIEIKDGGSCFQYNYSLRAIQKKQTSIQCEINISKRASVFGKWVQSVLLRHHIERGMSLLGPLAA